MSWFTDLRQHVPIFTTRGNLDSAIREAVDSAVLEEIRWGNRTEAGTVTAPVNDPFRQLRSDPYDRSSLYTQESVGFVIPADDIALRSQLKDFSGTKLKRVIEGVSRMISAATGGMVTVGESGAVGGMSSSRDIEPEHLFLAQDAAVLKVRSDPHATGIVNNLQFYTIGKGVTWGTPSEEVTSFLTKFRVMNRMELRERSMVREIYQEGEYFWVYFVDPDNGCVKVRKWRPREVSEIETHPEDVETRLAYHREAGFKSGVVEDRWYQDINYEVQVEEYGSERTFQSLQPNVYVQMSKYGDLDQVRGWPPMYSSLRWLKYLDDFIVDRARLHHEQSKVIWFQQRKGSATRKGSGRSALNPLLAPKGGSMWIEDDTVSYRASSPDLHSSDSERDALLLIYAISSGNCQPMHVWNQRSDQSNYASIRKADTPFSQAISANATFLREEWEERDNFVIRQGIKAGALPPEVSIIKHDEALVIRSLQRINEMVVEGRDSEDIIKEASSILAPGMRKTRVPTGEVPITRTFPDVVQEAPLDMAKVLLIHQKMGIASDATLSTKAGYDWHEELLHRLQEAKQKAALEATELFDKESELKRFGLPNLLDQHKADKAAAKKADAEPKDAEDDGEEGTPGGGRAPGSGAGTAKVSRDDLSAGGDAKTDVTPKKTQ